MYGDHYLNNGIYMGNQNPNNGFGNMNYYGIPHLNLIIISYNIIENIELLVCCGGENFWTGRKPSTILREVVAFDLICQCSSFSMWRRKILHRLFRRVLLKSWPQKTANRKFC